MRIQKPGCDARIESPEEITVKKRQRRGRLTGMKASELFFRICRDLEELSEYISRIEEERLIRAGDPPGALAYLGDYNYTTLVEIRNRDGISPDFEIDSAIVDEFQHALDRYLDTYAPGAADLKCYVLNISLYLTFIAKKPLHPPEVPFSGDILIVKKGKSFYCSGKRRFTGDDPSLCRYCVCRPQ